MAISAPNLIEKCFVETMIDAARATISTKLTIFFVYFQESTTDGISRTRPQSSPIDASSILRKSKRGDKDAKYAVGHYFYNRFTDLLTRFLGSKKKSSGRTKKKQEKWKRNWRNKRKKRLQNWKNNIVTQYRGAVNG